MPISPLTENLIDSSLAEILMDSAKPKNYLHILPYSDEGIMHVALKSGSGSPNSSESCDINDR